jgi:hypothetical protein
MVSLDKNIQLLMAFELHLFDWKIKQYICYIYGLRFKFAKEYKCVIYLIMFVILLTGYNHLANDMCNER